MKKLTSLFLILVMVTIVALPALADNAALMGKIYHDGVEVGNVFDNRVTVTCEEILFPGVAPGNYTKNQLDKIASTWIEFKLEPNGMMPIIFGGGAKWTTSSGKHDENEGVAAYIGSTAQTIKIRNGELILWNLLEDLHADIKNRMVVQIQEGNLDIHHELAFKACSAEIAGYFDSELLKNNNIRIIDP